MDVFIDKAIEPTARNVRSDGEPFDAVLVHDDIMVAEAFNVINEGFDISAHAELNVIRKAQTSLQTHDLSSYIMYAGGEPSPFCPTSLYDSRIMETYCTPVDEALECGLGKSKVIYGDLREPREEHIIQMPLQEGQVNPITLWKERL